MEAGGNQFSGGGRGARKFDYELTSDLFEDYFY
jgi:hypothetical protein